jgi:sugar lactone lactonase YvrE
VAFGGSRRDRLYITSARAGRDEPLAGAVFVADPNVAGLPAHDFAA